MRKIVILNCPPRSGKDTIAELFAERHGYKMLSFKEKGIEIALAISNVSREEWNKRYQENKDVPWEKLGGLSQRNYLIKISEEWIKPLHGKSYFGDIIAQDVHRNHEFEHFILPDGGFKEELQPLWEFFGDSVLILQWGRKGCTFEYDSRDWIMDYPDITRRIDDNNGTIEEHYERVRNAIQLYFEEYHV